MQNKMKFMSSCKLKYSLTNLINTRKIILLSNPKNFPQKPYDVSETPSKMEKSSDRRCFSNGALTASSNLLRRSPVKFHYYWDLIQVSQSVLNIKLKTNSCFRFNDAR